MRMEQTRFQLGDTIAPAKPNAMTMVMVLVRDHLRYKRGKFSAGRVHELE